jgi:hypothetical protein
MGESFRRDPPTHAVAAYRDARGVDRETLGIVG